MVTKDVVLLISEKPIDKAILDLIRIDKFTPVEASCEAAAESLRLNVEHIMLIILDTCLPIEPHKRFLAMYSNSFEYKSIPLIIVSDKPAEESAYLAYGVWDFMTKPIEKSTFRLRAKNAIRHSNFVLTNRLQYLQDFDPVSGIYNKRHFFIATKKMLEEHPNEQFALFHFDIQRFRLINSFFGMDEGDNFIKYIANRLKRYENKIINFSYGHISGDIFAFCISYHDCEELVALANKIRNGLEKYPLPFAIQPRIGITLIKDNTTDINLLFDQAVIASKNCTNNYLQHYCFYEDSMNEKTIEEQYIVNNMVRALEQEQFIVYLQPKYDLRTNEVDGAEALVRWNNPERGLISPGIFIPIFERNGFIVNLDYYIWEQVCILLRRWLDEGRPICPISVNISRVDLFNPRLVEKICGLVENIIFHQNYYNWN